MAMWAIVPAMSAVANVFLGQTLSRGGMLAQAEMRSIFRELCTRLGVARSDSCGIDTLDAVAGALHAAGIGASLLDDVAGLVVLRTVVALANEAADAVTLGIASARDIDVAMQKGVNYPRGPLAWADEIGVARVRNVLLNLAAHYGEDRYRLSPLIARRHAVAAPLADKPAAA